MEKICSQYCQIKIEIYKGSFLEIELKVPIPSEYRNCRAIKYMRYTEG